MGPRSERIPLGNPFLGTQHLLRPARRQASRNLLGAILALQTNNRNIVVTTARPNAVMWYLPFGGCYAEYYVVTLRGGKRLCMYVRARARLAITEPLGRTVVPLTSIHLYYPWLLCDTLLKHSCEMFSLFMNKQTVRNKYAIRC